MVAGEWDGKVEQVRRRAASFRSPSQPRGGWCSAVRRRPSPPSGAVRWCGVNSGCFGFGRQKPGRTKWFPPGPAPWHPPLQPPQSRSVAAWRQMFLRPGSRNHPPRRGTPRLQPCWTTYADVGSLGCDRFPTNHLPLSPRFRPRLRRPPPRALLPTRPLGIGPRCRGPRRWLISPRCPWRPRPCPRFPGRTRSRIACPPRRPWPYPSPNRLPPSVRPLRNPIGVRRLSMVRIPTTPTDRPAREVGHGPLHR